MQHEPCGLLRDTKAAMDFIATDAVFAVDDKPCGREPLFQGERRIFKDGPGLEREAGPGVVGVALPHAGVCEPRYVVGTAMGAFHHSVRPAQLDHELAAMLEVGEIEDRVSEGCFAVHD